MDGGLGVDGVAVSVDGYVVVVPAEGDELSGWWSPPWAPWVDVVGLEPVAAVASFDRTLVLIPELDEPADRAGDRLSHVRIGEGVEPVGDDEADLAGAEDLGQSVGSDSGSGRDRCSLLSERSGGQGGVDEHFGHCHRPPGFRSSFGGAG